jgi:hypothetical protein
MISIYLALASFIGASVLIGVMAFAGLKGTDWVPVTIGIFGTICLLYGSLSLIRESRMGLEALNIEMDFIRKIGKHHTHHE